MPKLYFVESIHTNPRAERQQVEVNMSLADDAEAKENESAFTDDTYSLIAQREIGRSIYLRALLLQRSMTNKEDVILDEDKLRYGKKL